MLFDLRDKSELRRKSLKAFPFRRLRKRCVHIGPFVILAFRRVQKIIRRIPETAELLKPQLRVLLLVIRGPLKQLGDLLESLLFCNRRKIGVLTPRLSLTGKRRVKILLGFAPRVLPRIRHDFSPLR